MKDHRCAISDRRRIISYHSCASVPFQTIIICSGSNHSCTISDHRRMHHFRSQVYHFRSLAALFETTVVSFQIIAGPLRTEVYHFRSLMCRFRSPVYHFRSQVYHFRSQVYHFTSHAYHFRSLQPESLGGWCRLQTRPLRLLRLHPVLFPGRQLLSRRAPEVPPGSVLGSRTPEV